MTSADHFQLNATSLSKNLLRTLAAQTDMPPLEAFPKSHQVTFKYYAGVIHFVDEDYVKVCFSAKFLHRSVEADSGLLPSRQKSI